MMISPDWFIEEHKEKSYAELLPVRDELIKGIKDFESRSYDPEDNMMNPSPEVIYQCNLQYLSKLCDLIADKYNHEIVWGNNES